METLEAVSFEVQSTYHKIKDKTPGQMVFGKRHDRPNQTHSRLEIHTSAQASAN